MKPRQTFDTLQKREVSSLYTLRPLEAGRHFCRTFTFSKNVHVAFRLFCGRILLHSYRCRRRYRKYEALFGSINAIRCRFSIPARAQVACYAGKRDSTPMTDQYKNPITITGTLEKNISKRLHKISNVSGELVKKRVPFPRIVSSPKRPNGKSGRASRTKVQGSSGSGGRKAGAGGLGPQGPAPGEVGAEGGPRGYAKRDPRYKRAAKCYPGQRQPGWDGGADPVSAGLLAAGMGGASAVDVGPGGWRWGLGT